MSNRSKHASGNGGPWGYLRYVMSSRNSLLVVIVLETFVCMVLLTAIYCGAEVSSGPGNWLCIRSCTSKQLAQLRQELEQFKENSVSRDKYDNLQQRIDDLERTTINIGLLPEEIKADDPNSSLAKIRTLVSEIEHLQQDTSFSIAVVSREITANGVINTNQPVNNPVRRLNCHIQRCLQTIGCFDGQVDGDREGTYSAVTRFQQTENLKGDGIIGRKTWMAFTSRYERLRNEG